MTEEHREDLQAGGDFRAFVIFFGNLRFCQIAKLAIWRFKVCWIIPFCVPAGDIQSHYGYGYRATLFLTGKFACDAGR